MYINRIIALICILLGTIVVYFPLTELNFARPDDGWMLLEDSLVRPEVFDFQYIIRLFSSYNSLQYSPLNTLVYALIYLINGYDPYWYHLACLLIHIINIYLVYRFGKLIFLLFKIQNHETLAWLVSFIWAIHPLNVESVVWISASKIPLFSLFCLASFLALVKSFLSHNWKYYAISLLMFVLSCFCKEQAVVFPAIFAGFFIVYYLLKKDFNVKKWIVLCLPFLFISIVFCLITLDAQRTAIGLDAPMSNYSFGERIIFSFSCFAFYIYNLVIPINLHYHYVYPIKPGQDFPIVFFIMPGCIIFIVTSLYFILKRHKENLFYLFCFLFFLVNLALCLQVFPLRRPAVMADRYMYLPSIGLIMIGVSIGQKYLTSKGSTVKKVVFAVTAIYIIALIIYGNQLVTNWHNLNIRA